MPFRVFHRFASRLAALFVLTCTAALAQTTIHVPADQATIQAGINAAHTGDTVLVAPGTYFENIDFKGKAITVTSSDGAAKTIIDGGGAGATVAMISGETRASILSNLTITHGGPGRTSYGLGGVGGVEVANSMPTILNNIITQNYCQGISVNSAAALIQGNVVSSSLTPEKCDVLQSGGILIGNPYMSTTYPYVEISSIIIGNTIENNTTGQQGDGGGDGGAGIELWGSASVIKGNIIRNNKTISGSGGGINIVFGGGFAIVQNLIYGNSAGCGGGGIGLGDDGGIGIRGLIVANNTIVDNTQGTGGGYSDCAHSVQLWSPFDESGPSTLFVNNIISGSSSFPAFVCGLAGYAGSRLPSEGEQALFDHNILYNGGNPFLGAYCVDTSNLHGNISADPQFADPARSDYHLKATSPAIDAGNNSATQELLTLKGVNLTQDFDGHPREQDATGKGTPVIDMGAYEFGGTVDGSPTRIVLSPSAYTGSAGSNYTLTATLSSALGTPTGPVAFFLDGQQVGVAAANGGVATLNNVTFTPGVHVGYASYAGQGSFPPAISVVVIIQIDRYSTSLSITSLPDPSYVGQPVTFTIKTSSSDPGYIPTPIVLTDYLNNNSPVATVTPDSSGTATYTTNSLSVGFHDIYANYGGDSTHGGSSADARQTVLDPDSTTISALSGLNPSILGQSVTFTGTVVSTGGSLPTGSISFFDGSSPLGTVALDPAGKAALAISSLTVATHTITFKYIPTGAFGTSSISLIQQVRSGYPTSITLTGSPNPSISGQNVTFTTTITSTNGTPTGSVQFTDNGTSIGTQTLDASGVATLSTSTLSVGIHNITATYIPTGSFAGTSSSITQTVNDVTDAINLTSSLNPSTYGQTVTITAHVVSSSGVVPTGVVRFTDGGQLLGTQTVDASGNAAVTVSTLSVGAHIIIGAFTPTNTTHSIAGTLTQQVNGLATSTLLTATPLTGVAHITPITLTATVAPAVPGGPTPTGQVLFYVNGAQFNLATLVNGVATYASPLPAGVDQIYAAYVGDPTSIYNSSNSNTVSVTITAAPSTLTLLGSPNPAPALTPFSIAAQLGTPSGFAPGAGYPITFTIAPATTVQPSTNTSGIATYTSAGLLPGQYLVTATFAGTTDLQPSTATSFIETITANPTATTLTANPNPGIQNNPVTFTSTVSALAGSASASGSITIYDSLSPSTAFTPITTLAIPSTAGSTTATFTTSALAPGTHVLYAAFTPAAGFAPSQSAQFTLVIEPQSFTLTLSDPTLTVQTGHHRTETATLTSIGGLTGTFTLSCGTLPPYATCTWGQGSVTLPANGTVSTSLTVDTDQLLGFLVSNTRPAPNPRAPFTARFMRHEWAAATAFTLFPLTLLGLRRRRNLRSLLPLLLLAALASTLTACGANQYPSSTTPGTYTVHITAAGSPAPGGVSPTQTVDLTLAVTR